MSVFTISSDYSFSYSTIQDFYRDFFYIFDRRQSGYIKDLNEKNSLILMTKEDLDSNFLNTSNIEFSCFDKKKKITFPTKITPELARETGYSLGDGYISDTKFEYRLKGNKNNEREFYDLVVKPLYKKLYNLDVKIRDYDATVGFEEYSKAFWEFKVKSLGIKPGKKTAVRVPALFMNQNKFVLAQLIQGLFDTDGNIYFKSQGKRKAYYPIVSIETISRGLAQDIYKILTIMGFKAYFWGSKKKTIRNPGGRFLVRISGYKNFDLYKKLIGTRQPKNIAKVKAWEEKA